MTVLADASGPDASGGEAPPDTRWPDAMLAAALIAVDPAGLGGAVIRSSAGPVRDEWLARFRALLPPGTPLRRVPVGIADGSLLGGLDLSATLQSGRPVVGRGVLAEADGGIVILAMAERLSPGTAARLSAVLDSGEVRLERDGIAMTNQARIGMVALDEGLDEEEHPPRALADRLAFRLDLDGVALRDLAHAPPSSQPDVPAARVLLPIVSVPDQMLDALCAAGLALGIDSLRAPLLALKTARAAAALDGRVMVETKDVALAARLVLGHRATCLPASESEEDEAQEPPPPDQQDSDTPPPEDPAGEQDQPPLDDMILAAAAAAIPAGLLARLRAGQMARAKAAAAGRTGAQQTGGGRGRPAGTRRGEPRQGQRLNILETLRAAAPWQKLRGLTAAAATHAAPRIAVRKDDFRVTRIKRHTPSTTIFVVDASGSAAFQRLAEAKGAVELLLADCYVRRDEVALLTFRGPGAELLLPPTRSLVRAKRSLSGFPGGGGTPLATGIDAAIELADSVRRKGATPAIVLLTDGKANIARDGAPGRPRAGEDALAAARRLRAAGFPTLLVDTSPFPEPAARKLAAEMDALYLPLPRNDAATLSGVVRAMAPGQRPARAA